MGDATVRPLTVLLGGDKLPLALNVQFLRATEHRVVKCLNWGKWERSPTGGSLPETLESLLPFEAPPTRILTCQAGPWTALVNNFIDGGDSSAPGPAIARQLGVDCVSATHAPRYGPGHAQTQLAVMGPSGEPPLMYIRTLFATATDGRWEWDESGSPFPFEDTTRYSARLKRERFDRPLLLTYLAGLEIPVEDEGYGDATLHQMKVDWPRRVEGFDEARALFAPQSARPQAFVADAVRARRHV